MYIAQVFAENFRRFGSATCECPPLTLDLQPDLNVLVGENDSGKTAAVDAIRHCLRTTSAEYFRVTNDDLHTCAMGRAPTFRLRCTFGDLSISDVGSFLEHLTLEKDGSYRLHITFDAKEVAGRSREFVAFEVHSGPDGQGPAVEGSVRELLRTTYLRPLRDAEAEMSSGRGSRLAQVLQNVPQIEAQKANDFDKNTDEATTLVGIMKRADHQIEQNTAVIAARTAIDRNLDDFRLGHDVLKSEIAVSQDSTLLRILEKLDLRIAAPSESDDWTRRGLGYNNAIFMSVELILLGGKDVFPTLLIEEPEAHLHPQMQSRVVRLLTKPGVHASPEDDEEDDLADFDQATNQDVQVIVTTHSPNLASSVELTQITVMSKGRTFPMGPEHTMLTPTDYAFLQRFLDVTKANLLFARGVIFVEGTSEELLLPAFAYIMDLDLSTHGVSVVNVGHTGLFRFSNIFRRRDDTVFPTRVACLRDLDIVPTSVPVTLRGKLKTTADYPGVRLDEQKAKLRRHDGGSVRTFLSDAWTLEFSLARSSDRLAKLMCEATALARVDFDSVTDTEAAIVGARAAGVEAYKEAVETFADPDVRAAEIYRPLRRGTVSKAVMAQWLAHLLQHTQTYVTEADLPQYIIDGITHATGGEVAP